VLIQEKINCLQEAIEASTKRKARKQRYIRAEETLTVSKVLDLIAKQADSSRKDSKTPAKRVRAGRHYGTCSKTKHNFCTYKVEIKNAEDSDKSE
jgi:phage-related minor tail protein